MSSPELYVAVNCYFPYQTAASKRTRPGFGPAVSEKYGSSIHSRERGVRASCFDDLGIVRRGFAPANAPSNPRIDHS